MNIYFRDPENFEHPELFDPDRFSKENAENHKKMSFLAFGEGETVVNSKELQLKLSIANCISRSSTVHWEAVWFVPSKVRPRHYFIKVPGGAF